MVEYQGYDFNLEAKEKEMSEEQKQAFDKAVEGLKHDSEGLLESDELLRDEILSIKLDYLTDCVGALGRLVIGMPTRKRTVIDNYRKEISAAHAEAVSLTIRSIEGYKERHGKQE